jgi:hypothetical protein
MSLNKEALLELWFDTDPTERSPYVINGRPPMWETLKDGDLTLFTHPGKTQVRFCHAWETVEGVHYMWQRDGKWVGQGVQTTFEQFEKSGPAKYGIEPKVIVPKKRTRAKKTKVTI